MHTPRKTPPYPAATLWLLGISVVVAPLHALAQESMLGGLGWHKNSAGTQVDAGSQIQVLCDVEAGIRVRVDLPGGRAVPPPVGTAVRIVVRPELATAVPA